MNKWHLPASLRVGDADCVIRADYRVILGIFRVMDSNKYTESEKWNIALQAFYKGNEFANNVEEAIRQMILFWSCGVEEEEEDKRKPKLMDWEQDANILIPAINRVAGFDIRGVDFLHWWTFLGYYAEVGESTFSTVVGIRRKMAYGKKLEDYEREFVNDNQKLVFLRDEQRQIEDAEDAAALAEIGL